MTDKLDTGGLIWVLFLEVHHQTESAILKGRVCGTDNDGIPNNSSVHWPQVYLNSFVPGHDIVGYWRGRDASGGVGLHALRDRVSGANKVVGRTVRGSEQSHQKKQIMLTGRCRQRSIDAKIIELSLILDSISN